MCDCLSQLSCNAMYHVTNMLHVSTSSTCLWCQETYTKSEAARKQKSLSKTLFNGKFNLTEDDFQTGLANGEFFEVQVITGATKYSWDLLEHTTAKGITDSSETKQQADATAEDAGLVELTTQDWKIGLFKATQSTAAAAAASSSSHTGPTMLALEDLQKPLSQKKWQMAKEQLETAMGAFDKLKNSAKKLLVTMDKEKDAELFTMGNLGGITKLSCCMSFYSN